MKRNGSITAFNREWPLYEQWRCGVLVLRMLPSDEAEMKRLMKVIVYAWV